MLEICSQSLFRDKIMEHILRNLMIAFGTCYLFYRIGSFLFLLRKSLFNKKDEIEQAPEMETISNDELCPDHFEVSST